MSVNLNEVTFSSHAIIQYQIRKAPGTTYLEALRRIKEDFKKAKKEEDIEKLAEIFAFFRDEEHCEYYLLEEENEKFLFIYDTRRKRVVTCFGSNSIIGKLFVNKNQKNWKRKYGFKQKVKL